MAAYHMRSVKNVENVVRPKKPTTRTTAVMTSARERRGGGGGAVGRWARGSSSNSSLTVVLPCSLVVLQRRGQQLQKSRHQVGPRDHRLVVVVRPQT